MDEANQITTDARTEEVLEKSDSLATIQPDSGSEPPPELHVYALDARQMQKAQGSISDWLNRRIAFEKARESDLISNYEIAHKNHWRSSALQNQMYHCQRLIRYYEKLKGAVDAGYCIIPNFPIDLFAVRVRESARKNTGAEELSYSTSSPDVCNVDPKALPAGEGKYVSDSSMYRHGERTGKDQSGKDKTIHWYEGSTFLDVELPIHVVKPEVMNEVARAMSLKVFDAIGVCPESPRKDPMVIGRIFGTKSGYSQAQCSFLIAWYLDVHRL